jgi:glyoxylase-like metal-dependent hydrolase (beta-lactamase superfamily II)
MISRRYGQFAADHGIDDSPAAKTWVRDSGKTAPVDLLLTGGERIRLGDGWEIALLHTPGHSHGHLTVWDPRNRAAIIADAVLGKSINTTSGAPVLPPTYRYVDAYRASIEQIEALRPEWLLTSHFPVLRANDVPLFLSESRSFTDQVDRTILTELDESPQTTAEVIRRVGPLIGPWPVEDLLPALAFPLVGHLELLTGLGLIRQDRNEDGLITWSAST